MAKSKLLVARYTLPTVGSQNWGAMDYVHAGGRRAYADPSNCKMTNELTNGAGTRERFDRYDE